MYTEGMTFLQAKTRKLVNILFLALPGFYRP